MGADRARRSFDASRMYRAVVAQQGRVTLEADANEAVEISKSESRAELVDLVGPTGSPDSGFKIVVPPPGGGINPFDFGIAAGTMYVGGVRVVQSASTTYERQKQSEWRDFPAGSVAVDPMGAANPMPVLAVAVFPPTPAKTPPFAELVYLSVTEQEVSAVEDRALREVALGGPDTSARTRLVQHVVRAPAASDDCEAELARVLTGIPGLGFDEGTRRVTSTGRLKAGFVVAAAPADPCEPTAQAGFLGAENQLIRVQVTGDRSLLWGYDNASFLYRGTVGPDQQSIVLAATPVDVYHQPRPGQWIEVLDVAVELGGGDRIAASVGMPYAINGYDEASKALQLPGAVTQHAGAEVFVRVWENQLTFVGDSTTGTELLLPEGTGTGVVVTTKGAAVAGDHWLIGVRPSNPTSILPARLHDDFQAPDGPDRWATPLALLQWTAPAVAQVHDCRRPFDDLVELTRAKGCELMLRPGDPLQELVAQHIKINKSTSVNGLHIHFGAGRFELVAPLEVAAVAGGHVTVSGCGLATEIIANGSETAIVISGWDTSTVHDLSIVAGDAPTDQPRPHLGGALTILDTGSASVSGVTASCGKSASRGATCVTIRNETVKSDTVARVRSCDLRPGANQVGVLLVNTAMATIEDNRISLRAGATADRTITRRMLASNIRVGSNWTTAPAERSGRTEITSTLWGDQILAFRTDASLEALWSAAFEAHRAELGLEGRVGDATLDDRRRIRDFFDRAITQILRPGAAGPLSADQVFRFRVRLTDQRRGRRVPAVVAAGQGIVVAGAVATDIRVLNNTIESAMQGVHIGLSQKQDGRTPYLVARRVQVIGNTVRQRVPADQGAPHAGIFVGNAESTTIRDNSIECELARKGAESRLTRRAEAIRVWGVAGSSDGYFLIISGNVSRNASTGIRVVQVVAPQGDSLVQITQNLAISADTPIMVNGAYEVALDNRP